MALICQQTFIKYVMPIKDFNFYILYFGLLQHPPTIY